MKTSIKHAIILSLIENITELTQLAETLGYQIQKTFIQNRTTPDANTYVGTGKVEEVHDYLDDADPTIDLVIINGELKPSQWFTLEKGLKTEVYDKYSAHPRDF